MDFLRSSAADTNPANHVLINNIDNKAKCRHQKYWAVKGLCRRCLSGLRPLPLLCFCLWRFYRFWRFWIWVLLINMVSNRTQHPPHPPSHTLSINSAKTCRSVPVCRSNLFRWCFVLVSIYLISPCCLPSNMRIFCPSWSYFWSFWKEKHRC